MREEFDRCWPWLESALARYGHTHTKEQVWRRIERGYADFWPAENSAVVSEVIQHPSGLRTCHFWLAGGDLASLVGQAASIEGAARADRCDRMTIMGRAGWLRALDGYHLHGVRLAKDLRNGR